MLTDEEIAETVIDRLIDFAPAVSIKAAPDLEADQVEVTIIMSRESQRPPEFTE